MKVDGVSICATARRRRSTSKPTVAKRRRAAGWTVVEVEGVWVVGVATRAERRRVESAWTCGSDRTRFGMASSVWLDGGLCCCRARSIVESATTSSIVHVGRALNAFSLTGRRTMSMMNENDGEWEGTRKVTVLIPVDLF